MEKKKLVLEQEFKVPKNQVWRAITETGLMKKWYFDISNFKLEVGNKFTFEGGTEEKRYTHLCEILEIVPQKKLKYSWAYKGYTGLSFLIFELSGMGDETKLKLTHVGLETFDQPDFKQGNFVEGWNYLIQESLKKFLETGKALRYW